jgi:hypothetical protein
LKTADLWRRPLVGWDIGMVHKVAESLARLRSPSLFAHWMHQFEKSPVDCEAIRAFPEPRKCYSKRCRFAESFQQRTSGAALDVGSMQDVHATLIRKRLLCPSTDTATRLNAVARPYLIRVRRPGHYLHAGSRSVAAAYSLRPSGVRCLRASKMRRDRANAPGFQSFVKT